MKTYCHLVGDLNFTISSASQNTTAKYTESLAVRDETHGDAKYVLTGTGSKEGGRGTSILPAYTTLNSTILCY